MIIRPDEFDPDLIRRIGIQKRKGRPGARKKQPETHHYKDVICAFDIETTKISRGRIPISRTESREDYISYMYIWQLQIGVGLTIIGRTWPEFVSLLKEIALAVGDHNRLVVYVHNLSYEFSFLRDQQVLGPLINEDTVFCLKPRKIAKFLCCSDRIEFRCSYIHSNMGLDAYTEKMRVKHRKLSGEDFDYSKVRYPWTELTPRELEYCANDVIGLVEALTAEMTFDHDDLYSIPLTSTGYVRRDIKKALERKQDWIQRLIPDIGTYVLLREAFRGGDTHASRFYAGKILPGPIRSVDRSSSYPDVMLNRRYPISEVYRPEEKDRTSWNALIGKMRKDRAIVARISIDGLALRDPLNPVPYLSSDKCRSILGGRYDNGRLLSADYLETTITDIDLFILLQEYDGSISVMDWQYARYGPLPEELKNVVRDYYVKKTQLKNVAGQEIFYEKSKNKLNSTYGCAAQDPVRLTIHYDAGDYVEGATIDGVFYPGSLEQYLPVLLDQARPVMPYQWGVWTTALARHELRMLIWTCGRQFIYCDTDSVYYWGDVDFSQYNRDHQAASIKNEAYADDPAGIIHYMGMVEEDSKNGPYQEFKTLGAKKYAYRDRKGVLHITISGVVKDEGARELERAGGLKAFDPGTELQSGFVFRDAGGVDVIYQDQPIGILQMDGHELYVGTGAVLVDSTYTLSLSTNYQALLDRLVENDCMDIFRRSISGQRIDTQSLI